MRQNTMTERKTEPKGGHAIPRCPRRKGSRRVRFVTQPAHPSRGVAVAMACGRCNGGRQ